MVASLNLVRNTG